MVELQARNWRSPANRRFSAGMALTIVAAIVVLGPEKGDHAQSSGVPYPKMAAMDQYLMTEDSEVALARSAAPESISKDADVLVLDRNGYRTAVKGRNGFVCAVQRSWTAGLDDPEFWNPKLRAPICFNQPAARSYLDGFAGIAGSYVTGGLAIAIPHGPGVPYYHDDNIAPTIGVRFAF